MKELILKIPEKKLKFFLELCKQLGFEVSEKKADYDEKAEISEEHKSIVRERIEKSTSNADRVLDWEESKNKLKF